MQKRVSRLLLLAAVALLPPFGAAAADRSPFEPVVARVGRGAAAGCGTLISKDGLLVTARGNANAKGKTPVHLAGAPHAAAALQLPNLKELAVLSIPPAKGSEFYTLGFGVASTISPGARVQIAGPAGALGAGEGNGIAMVESQVRDVEMDPTTGAHYLRLELSFAPALAGAPVCDPQDQRLVAVIVPDPKGQPGCRALTVDSLKEALFDAGRAVKPRVAPGLKGGDVGPEQISPDGMLNRAQVLDWSFPIHGGGYVQSMARMLTEQAWREISGFQLAPLTALRQHDDGTEYFSTLGGTLYAVNPENQSLLWRYDANEEAVALHAPAVAEDNVFLATGNLGLLAQQRAYTGGVVDLLVDLFGLRVKTTLALNQGSIHAVDRRTGQFKWLYETRLVGAPQVVGSSVCFGGLGVYGALDTGTGKERWIRVDEKKTREANWYCLQSGNDGILYGLVVPIRVEGSATRKDPLRIVGEGDIRALAIDAATGNTLWTTKLMEPEEPTRRPMAALTMVDGDGTIYAVFGQDVFVLDKGGALRTRFTQKSAVFSERMAVSDGVIFLAGDDHRLHALSGADGTPLWTFSQARGPVVAPVVQDGIVYIGSFDSNIYAVDEKTGQLFWRFECDRRISGRPYVRDGKLLCASEEGRLWRIRLPHR